MMPVENTLAASESLLRSALTVVRNHAGRELFLSEKAITFTDFFGDSHELHLKNEVPVLLDQMRDLLDGSDFRSDSWRAKSDERDIDGNGTWLLSEGDDFIRLKIKKNRAPCVSALVSFDPVEIEALRSAYRAGGVDVFVSVEGETRSRELALAFAAERLALGLPTEVLIKPENNGPYWRRDADHKGSLKIEGPKLFEDDVNASLPLWTVEQIEPSDMAALMSDSSVKEGSSIFVSTGDRMAARRYANLGQQHLAQVGRPVAVVSVSLENSEPVGRVLISPELARKVGHDSGFTDAPWVRFEDRKAARAKTRPAQPKTWHSTTQQVADAFIARKAPRGYVSGDAIYFHGPVAFSIYDRNPIAALVDLADGTTAVFFGRDTGIGGTMAGTVSSAQGDIATAAREKGFRSYQVGQLPAFLRLGELPLDQLPNFKRSKNEADFPSTCKLDVSLFGRWLDGERAAAEQELDEAFKTTFPTRRKANAWSRLASLAEMGDEFEGLLGTSFPFFTETASEYRQLAHAEQAAATERLEAKRLEQNAAPARGM